MHGARFVNISTAIAGGNILISTSTGGANSGNFITNNNIGPAGANLPTKGVMSLGSASPNNNTGNVIDNNNIFDFFQAAVTTAAGVSVSTNTGSITISNNRIYQTAPRVFTVAATYSGIFVSVAVGPAVANITGNVIGFGAANGTGTTTVSGSTNQVKGINAPNTSTVIPSSIQGNTISGITQTSSATGSGSTSPFIGISVGATAGSFHIGDLTGNTIGSLDGSSGIVVNATSITANTIGFEGIFDFSFQNLDTINNNSIGTITINNGGAGTTAGFRGILLSGTPGQNVTVNNNIIGGTAANSITDNIVGSYAMYAYPDRQRQHDATGNLVRNITGNSNVATTVVGSGILSTASTGVNTISQNTIYSLSNNSGTASNSIYALYCSFATGPANIVERNFVHSLSITSTAADQPVGGHSAGRRQRHLQKQHGAARSRCQWELDHVGVCDLRNV